MAKNGIYPWLTRHWQTRVGFVCGSLVGGSLLFSSSVQTAPLPPAVWGQPTCAVPIAERRYKQELLRARGTSETAAATYEERVAAHRAQLADCRAETWPETQAVWLRLYSYDAQPDVLADVLDRVVNRGYNRVIVEVFYDGRILLPVSDNPTPWRSIMEEDVAAGLADPETDLWQMVIEEGEARGLEVYGWAFALNFGYSYQELPDREALYARNGRGETSVANAMFDPDLLIDGQAFYEDASETEHLFIDPYHPQAQAEIELAIASLVDRQPAGMVFDYVRYPTTPGRDTLINDPRELWIHGEASLAALDERLETNRERALMQRYLAQGRLDATDLEQLAAIYATDPAPLPPRATPQDYEAYLWEIAVNHAYEGVLTFTEVAATAAIAAELPSGVVFFPGGNRQELGDDGRPQYDARMQPWDQFARQFERHPMSYAICPDGTCVADQVGEVVAQSDGVTVCPILAGTWGQSFGGHVDLEIKMAALEAAQPQLDCVSHFVYSWMEPASDRERKASRGVGD